MRFDTGLKKKISASKKWGFQLNALARNAGGYSSGVFAS